MEDRTLERSAARGVVPSDGPASHADGDGVTHAMPTSATNRRMVRQFFGVVALLALPFVLFLGQSWSARIFGVLAGAAALWLWGYASHTARSGWRTRNWPRAFATIESLTTPHVTGGQRGAPGPYAARLTFSYTVGGQRFPGFATMRMPFDKVNADDPRQSYEAGGNGPGGTLLVYYDPADPAEFTLDPGDWDDAVPQLIVALGWTAIAVAIWRMQ